jgi:diaminopimelate epimerase
MRYRLTKMHGCGNDFLILDYMKEEDIYPLRRNEVLYLCDRHFGIGADGLAVVSRGRVTDAKWLFYNCDGTEAEMCGNAARCVMRFLGERYFPNHEVISLETKVGVIKGQLLDEAGLVEVTLLSAGLKKTEYDERVIRHNNQGYRMYCIDTGVPHAVMEVKDIRTPEVTELGKAFVNHEAFAPHGTNVTFFQTDIGQRILSTTFERGVETETFACGTGAAAAALIYSQLYMHALPIEVEVPGGILHVDVSPMSRKLLLRGPTSYVFETEVDDLPQDFEARPLYHTGKQLPPAPGDGARL